MYICFTDCTNIDSGDDDDDDDNDDSRKSASGVRGAIAIIINSFFVYVCVR